MNTSIIKASGGKAIGFIMTYNCSHLVWDAYNRVPKESLDAIIIVDDGSKDATETEKIARNLGVPFFSHEHTGYGGNVRYGLQKAFDMGADYMVEIHGDGQFDPSVIPVALEKMRNGDCDFFIGSRFTNLLQPLRDGMSLVRYVANIGLSFIDRLILRAPLSEYNAGFRVYSKNLVQTVPLEGIPPFEKTSRGHIYSFQIITQAAYFRLKFGEMPIRANYKKEHTSITIPESTVYAFQTFYILFLFILARLGLRTRLFRRAH
ncbi:MAG: glycosyltransferase family 2 protein [bacterium]|nr:glycosyltransferase family 2 protein [bacterium]